MITIGRFLIHPGELLRLDLGPSLGLHCDYGRMLITTDGEARDHELGAGESLACGGLVLVEGEGELLVERSRAPSWLGARERIELIAAKSIKKGERRV